MRLNVTKDALVHKLAEMRQIKQTDLRACNEAARKQKRSVFQVLTEKEIISDEDLTGFLCSELKLPTLRVSALRIPKEITKLIPKKMVDKYHVLPVARIQNVLTVAVHDPFEIMQFDDLKEVTGCDIVLTLLTSKSLANAIETYYSDSVDFDTVLENIDAENIEIVKEEKSQGENEKNVRAGASEAPVVRMVNLIVNEAIKSRASDIHFEPYEKDFRVRYRIDGALKESFTHSKEIYTALVARMKIISQLNITEKRVPQDGRFRLVLNGREIDFRVSILPTYHGEKMVLRVLDKSGVKSGLDKLGFSEKPTSVFAEAIKHPYGMILVTGPTGSGKSTTLYTILNTMNTPDRNIMTIEDPVEYQVEGITQSMVNSEVGLTFATGLRSLLRQSPDIVLVGEIRDGETADIGVKAALTGHLVFSTLHTNSAAGAMTRLIDMGVEPFLIASSVICVAAQRLMRKICPHCKEETKLSEEVLRRCKIDPAMFKSITPYKGAGCAKCNRTGYLGRVATIEVLKVDPVIRDLVVQRKSSDVIGAAAIERGMETLFENAFGLFKNGITTLDEVLRVSMKG